MCKNGLSVNRQPVDILLFFHCTGQPAGFCFYLILILLPTPFPVHCFVTMILFSIRSFNSATWEMIPTIRWPSARLLKALTAWESASSAREPKRSSHTMESRRIPPALAWISSESPRARDREAWKDSPPERVFTLLSVPL